MGRHTADAEDGEELKAMGKRLRAALIHLLKP